MQRIRGWFGPVTADTAGLVKVLSRIGLALVLAVSLGVPALAQDEAPEASEPDVGIDEIIVTATKIEQSIRDVPISISAFQADDLAKRGVEDLTDLQRVTPSLIVGSSNSNTNGGVIRIRGMGTSGNNAGLESAVGVFIDGVFRSRAGLALQDLVDIERVEVLKGPQGTLFGKNTSAGAVSIITKKPTFEFGGNVAATVGNIGERKVQAVINLPLIDETLAFRMAGNWHKRDGIWDQTNGSDKYNDRDRWSLKAQLYWTPSEDFDARLILDYTEHNESCCVAGYDFINTDQSTAALPTGFPSGLAVANLLPGGLNNPALQDDAWKDLKAGSNYDTAEEFDDWGVQLETNWDLDDATITGVFSYREFDVFRAQDIDFSPVDILQPGNTSELWETWSVELRATGSYDLIQGLTWMVGFYASGEDVTQSGQVVFGGQGDDYFAQLTNPGLQPFFAGIINQRPGSVGGVDNLAYDSPYPGTGQQQSFKQETVTAALFTHNTVSLTENLDLTLGARFTYEEKEFTNIANGAPIADLENLPTNLNSVINNDTHCALGGPGFLAAGFLAFRQQIAATCDNLSWNDKFDNTDWSFFSSLLYRLTDEHNVFFTFAHGYKSGGWNANVNSAQYFPLAVTPPQPAGGPFTGPDSTTGIVTDGRQFDPEFTNNFELGLKSRMLDGRLTLNTTAFHTLFKNYQLQTFTGLFFFINNVPRVKSRGIEIEGFFAVNEWAAIQFGLTYADTRYGDSLGLPQAQEEALAGNRINSAPPWAGSVGLFLTYPIGDSGWEAVFNANLQYRGRVNVSSLLIDTRDVGDFFRTNAQIGARTEDGTWEIMFWMENYEDESTGGYFDAVFQAGGQSAFSGSHRLYGLTLKYSFGDD